LRRPNLTQICNPRRTLAVLVSLLLLVASSCAGGATGESPTPTSSHTTTPSATPSITPTATPLPDRADCDDIRGTAYRSAAERQYYLSRCIPPTATPGLAARGGPTSQPAQPQEPLPTIPPVPLTPGGVTAMGDSVMLGAEMQLRFAIPGLDFRAAESTQASAAIDQLRLLDQAGVLGSKVIVHIGTNGTFTRPQFEQMMEILKDVDLVLFLNVRVDRVWEQSNNAMLAANVPRYPNARLLDWRGFSAGHLEYFWNDGVHLRPAGAQAYTSLIASSL
jgi:hypothetical protein